MKGNSTSSKSRRQKRRGDRASGPAELRLAREPYVRPSQRQTATPTAPVLAREPPGTLQQVGREADAAWAGVKRIMSLLNVENKHVYYNVSGSNVTQAGSVLDLGSLISQGVGGAQRIGDSLKVLRVRVKMMFVFSGGGSTRQPCTVVLGHSRDGVPAVADVFAVVSSTTSGLAFPADTYQQVDKWSSHKTVPLCAVAAYGNDQLCEYVEFNQKFGHDVLYTNGSTTTASGSFWLAYISSEPTSFPTVDIAVDIEFVDN